MAPERERGAALLTVLLLVAILSVVMAVVLERLTIASRMTRNIVSADQGRAYLLSAEHLAATRIGDILRLQPDRTTLAGGWLGQDQQIAVPGGAVTARIVDRGNCFNLNSLAQGPDTGGLPQPDAGSETLTARPEAIAQFARLMRLLGIERTQAEQIAVAAADWIDTDSTPGNGGAEDAFYSQLKPAYRTANGPMADPSELLMVSGMSADIYQRLKPWLCALPASGLSPLNINTLLPGQAVLLAMVLPETVTIDQARQMLALRPVEGYGGLPAFWSQPALQQLSISDAVKSQIVQKTSWFELSLQADLGGDVVEETVLIDAAQQPVRIVRRQWGEGA